MFQRYERCKDETGSISKVLKASWLETKLGVMIAIADDNYLYLLEFADKRDLENEIKKLQLKIKATIIHGSCDLATFLSLELKSYFDGDLKEFQTPLYLLGSAFQKCVWEALASISYGSAQTYKSLAISIGRKNSYRALANANGANRLAIVIPCHRVISSSGALGGYSGGVKRKKWLLNHEKSNV